MSTIRVDNFGPSAGGTTYSARGIAKAWVNFDGTGTIAARDSENVSSLTDNGTGLYSVNLTNAFAANDYVASLNSEIGGGNGGFNQLASTASATDMYFVAYTNAGSLRDVNRAMIAGWGDLA